MYHAHQRTSVKSCPKRLIDCFDEDGGIDLARLVEYRRSKRKQFYQGLQDIKGVKLCVLHQTSNADMYRQLPRPKRRRACRKRTSVLMFDKTGNIVPCTPKVSPWYVMYVTQPNEDCTKFLNKFRRRFRIPYSEYKVLVNDIRSCVRLFKRWLSPNVACEEASPIELLVLGVLRYLGCGWTFDDLEEVTGISEEVHRVFFHKFIEYGSTELFAKHVVMPRSSEEAMCPEYDAAGLAGCIGSMDATHVMCKKGFSLYEAGTYWI